MQVRRPISGKLLRSFDGVGEADGNCGVAISPDGNVFAVSNYENQYIYIHSAADGSFIRSFGGHGAEPGEFDEVAKLCFAPNGHLLVAEDENARVQELTVSGEVVRIIGVGHIHGSVFGLAADDRYIIVGKDDEGPQLYLFSSSDGAFIRSIGEQGMLPGLLSDCSGIRFIAGGSQVIIAENESKRLSVYNITGEFVRTLCCDSLSSPDDVEIAWNGDIIVADCDVHRLCVFSPDGSTLLHMVGQDIAPLNLPTALALHPLTGALFVLNNEGRRVLVFE